MTLRKMAACIVFAVSIAGPVQADLLLDNGLATDDPNYMEVTLSSLGGGYMSELRVVDPASASLVNVLYDGGFLFRSGSSGAFTFMGSSDPILQPDGSALSSGVFSGPNGSIDFAIRTVLVGRQVTHSLALSSASPFGDVQIANYLDQDVFGSSDDVAVIVGTGPAAQIFTFDDETDVGIAHSTGWAASSNLSFLGWTVYEYYDDVGYGGGLEDQTFAPDGVVTLAPLTGYPYAEGNPAYGPSDVVSAFVFALDPAVTNATLQTGNGGVVEGIPEPSSLLLMTLACGVLMLRRRTRSDR